MTSKEACANQLLATYRGAQSAVTTIFDWVPRQFSAVCKFTWTGKSQGVFHPRRPRPPSPKSLEALWGPKFLAKKTTRWRSLAVARDIGLRSVVFKVAFIAQANERVKSTRQLGSCKQAWMTPAVEIHAAPSVGRWDWPRGQLFLVNPCTSLPFCPRLRRRHVSSSMLNRCQRQNTHNTPHTHCGGPAAKHWADAPEWMQGIVPLD